ETCESYEDPELAGIGPSTPSQTAWAVLGLLAAGRARTAAVERGVRYLIDEQQADGAWEDACWNGTGFPRVFMLKYHLSATYFPRWALGVSQRALDGWAFAPRRRSPVRGPRATDDRNRRSPRTLRWLFRPRAVLDGDAALQSASLRRPHPLH